MWEDNNIIVIDDNDQRRHDVQVILDFLGENPVTFPYQQWTEISRSDVAKDNTRQIKALVFGENGGAPLEQRLQQTQQWDRSCPIILMGEHQLDQVDDIDLQHKVIAQLEFPPSYNKFMDSLHRAQVYREQYDINAGRH